MKFFVMYAITRQGTRDFLWLRRLPADWDYQAWVNSRKPSMKVLDIARFELEVIEP